MLDQTTLENPKIKSHKFLGCMYNDSYFPKVLVDKCKNILLGMCNDIETQKPADLKQLYKLSHAATERINDLESEFDENDSEIETVARECLAMNFESIAKAYGFDADIEELIATREW
ncbi:MAG: hypothetical protein JXQ87_16445 [Bacteroidia bacterium]